jgi:hypothetical protein
MLIKTGSVTNVPEPSSLAIFSAGLFGLLRLRKRKIN